MVDLWPSQRDMLAKTYDKYNVVFLNVRPSRTLAWTTNLCIRHYELHFTTTLTRINNILVLIHRCRNNKSWSCYLLTGVWIMNMPCLYPEYSTIERGSSGTMGTYNLCMVVILTLLQIIEQLCSRYLILEIIFVINTGWTRIVLPGWPQYFVSKAWVFVIIWHFRAAKRWWDEYGWSLSLPYIRWVIVLS